MLGRDHRASSDETPLPISRRGRRGYGRASRGDNAGGDKEALIGVVQELNASIADMSRTDIEMGRAAKTELLFRKPQLTLMKRSNQVYMDRLLREIETAKEEIDCSG